MYKAVKALLTILVIIAIVLIIGMVCIGIAKADEETVIELTVIPQATPAPVPVPEDPRPVEIISHELNPKDVERIARLIWGSPAKDKQSKQLIVWCVMNRLYEPSGFFGDSIQKIVNQSEFAWFDPHDHRSEENLKIVRETMNQYLTWKEGGHNVGPHPSGRVYYIRSSEENRAVLEGSEHISPWETLSWVR